MGWGQECAEGLERAQTRGRLEAGAGHVRLVKLCLGGCHMLSSVVPSKVTKQLRCDQHLTRAFWAGIQVSSLVSPRTPGPGALLQGHRDIALVLTAQPHAV